MGTLRSGHRAQDGSTAVGGLAMGAGVKDEETQQLLSLANTQRMSTDVRRAIFMAVMGSEDASEAFERLARLGLKVGAQHCMERFIAICDWATFAHWHFAGQAGA